MVNSTNQLGNTAYITQLNPSAESFLLSPALVSPLLIASPAYVPISLNTYPDVVYPLLNASPYLVSPLLNVSLDLVPLLLNASPALVSPLLNASLALVSPSLNPPAFSVSVTLGLEEVYWRLAANFQEDALKHKNLMDSLFCLPVEQAGPFCPTMNIDIQKINQYFSIDFVFSIFLLGDQIANFCTHMSKLNW